MVSFGSFGSVILPTSFTLIKGFKFLPAAEPSVQFLATEAIKRYTYLFCCGTYICLAIMEGLNSVVKSRGKVQLNDQVLVHPENFLVKVKVITKWE